MIRLPRVAALAVLVAALSCCVQASASAVPQAHLEIARVFNPQSESLLAPVLTPPREMSLLSAALFNIALPAEIGMRDVALLLPAHFAAPSVPRANLAGIAPIRTFTAPPVVTTYSVPVVSPVPIEARTPSPAGYAAPPAVTKPLATIAAAPVHFGSYAAYAPPVQALSANVKIPVRVGGVHFSGIVSGSQAQSSHTDAIRAVQLCGTTDEASACPYLHESRERSIVAGTNFNVRTGDRNVNLQLSGSVEHLSNGDAAIFPYVPLDPEESFDAAHLNAAGPDSAMLRYPGVTALVKHAVDARVAVPITQRITLGLQYDTSHYQGDYADAIVQGLDARKDTYLGNVTYQLPNTSSAITLSARLYRYQDGLSQNYNLKQTRADLNFTVKF
jgi:hypothetical protein